MSEPLIKIDLHVHTSKGSPCAESHDPLTIADTMVRNDIQGLVITEHNTLWTQQEIDNLNTGLENRKIYRGMEISSGCHHFILIGIENTDKLFEGIDPDTLMKIVKDQGAVIILAHPYSGCSKNETISYPKGLMAVEVMSTVTRENDFTKAIDLCSRHHLKPVAGSDAHCDSKVGDFYTVFPSLPANETELATMIRKGQGSPHTGKTGFLI